MGIEDAEPLAERLKEYDVSRELLDAAERIEQSGEAAWDTFYVYDSDDDE